MIRDQSVEYRSHMGDDLMVVNVARVSFNVEHRMFDEKTDEGLIRYLARNNHWTPFGHPQIQFRIAAPIFVARQLVTHQIGLVWNEVSRRYVSDSPEFFLPDTWRANPDKIKQGSSTTETVTHFESHTVDEHVLDHYAASEKLYNKMLAGGICAEQCRMVLPLAMFTEWYWTGSLAAVARVCKLRLDSHAQKETRDIAEVMAHHGSRLFPVSWKYLMEEVDDTPAS